MDPSSMPRNKEHTPALSPGPHCCPSLARPRITCTISWQGVWAAVQDGPRTGPADPPEPDRPGLAEPSILITPPPEPTFGPAAACHQVSLLNEDEYSLERTLQAEPTGAAPTGAATHVWGRHQPPPQAWGPIRTHRLPHARLPAPGLLTPLPDTPGKCLCLCILTPAPQRRPHASTPTPHTCTPTPHTCTPTPHTCTPTPHQHPNPSQPTP